MPWWRTNADRSGRSAGELYYDVVYPDTLQNKLFTLRPEELALKFMTVLYLTHSAVTKRWLEQELLLLLFIFSSPAVFTFCSFRFKRRYFSYWRVKCLDPFLKLPHLFFEFFDRQLLGEIDQIVEHLNAQFGDVVE